MSHYCLSVSGLSFQSSALGAQQSRSENRASTADLMEVTDSEMVKNFNKR